MSGRGFVDFFLIVTDIIQLYKAGIKKRNGTKSCLCALCSFCFHNQSIIEIHIVKQHLGVQLSCEECDY
jgi:hypothetical protein